MRRFAPFLLKPSGGWGSRVLRCQGAAAGALRHLLLRHQTNHDEDLKDTVRPGGPAGLAAPQRAPRATHLLRFDRARNPQVTKKDLAMYVICILFVVIVLPLSCFFMRGCMWYELRKEQMVRTLIKAKMWDQKNPEAAAKRDAAAERAEEARAAAKSSRGVTFRRGDGGEPSSSAVAPMPPAPRPPPPQRQVTQPPPPPGAEMEPAGASRPGAFGRMRNAFGGGGPRGQARMQPTPIGVDAERGGGGAPAGGQADEYTDDDDYSGSEYTESTFTGVTQSQTATSVGLPPPQPARGGRSK